MEALVKRKSVCYADGMKKQTLEELKKSYDEKLAVLKKEREEALRKAKAKEEKKSAAERVKLRKQDTHKKIILGGYFLAEIMKTKDKALLKKVADTIKSERDKELIIKIADSF